MNKLIADDLIAAAEGSYAEIVERIRRTNAEVENYVAERIYNETGIKVLKAVGDEIVIDTAALEKAKGIYNIEIKHKQGEMFPDVDIDLKHKLNAKVKYYGSDVKRLEYKKNARIDLYVNSINKIDRAISVNHVLEFERGVPFNYYAGDTIRVGLGFAMELPEGYEAEITARSSTFKNWGLLQTNAVGVIDNTYKGDTDEWMIEFIAMREGVLKRGDKIAQFKIVEEMPKVTLEEVKELGNKARGGYGTTGR